MLYKKQLSRGSISKVNGMSTCPCGEVQQQKYQVYSSFYFHFGNKKTFEQLYRKTLDNDRKINIVFNLYAKL